MESLENIVKYIFYGISGCLAFYDSKEFFWKTEREVLLNYNKK